MNRISICAEGPMRTHYRIISGRNLQGYILAISLLALSITVPAHSQAPAAGAQRTSLGSLNSVGEVYVNDSRAPSELTIFPGDTVRTGATGTAILTTPDRGAFQLSPEGQAVFAGDPRYLVELKSGTINTRSSSGTTVATVKASNYVVVQTIRNVLTGATIAKDADGSYLITCSAGDVAVVPIEQTSGVFLQAGQSARISTKNELIALDLPTPAPAPIAAGTNHHLLLLGLIGAGAAGGIAAAVAAGGSHNPVSPSAP